MLKAHTRPTDAGAERPAGGRRACGGRGANEGRVDSRTGLAESGAASAGANPPDHLMSINSSGLQASGWDLVAARTDWTRAGSTGDAVWPHSRRR